MREQMLAGRIGTAGLFALGIAAVTPLTVVAGAVPLGFGRVEQLGTPAGYVLAALVLGLFAVGVSVMAVHVPNSGAFYSYAAAGLGRPAGVAAAGVALLAYNAIQIGLYGAFGVAAAALSTTVGGPGSWAGWALTGWAAVTVLGQLRVRMNARLLAALVAAEITVVVVADAVMLAHPAGQVVRFTALNPWLLADQRGVASLVGAITGLVGFEIPLAFAVLARDPRRHPRRAITLILAVVGVLYAGTAWAMTVVVGPQHIIATARAHLTDLFFVLPAPYLPPAAVRVAAVLFVTSLFAAMLAFHSTVARYTLTLAREGVLPGWLARTRADEVPVTAGAAQSLLAAAVIAAAIAGGWDPTVDLFFYGTVGGGLGVLILISLTAVAVARFLHHRRLGGWWRRRLAPGAAAWLLCGLTTVTVLFFDQLLGTRSPARTWAFPAGYLLAAAAGTIWARWLRRHQPHVYAVIGHGDQHHQPRPPGRHAHPPSRPGTAAGRAAAVARHGRDGTGAGSTRSGGPPADSRVRTSDHILRHSGKDDFL
ncbi:APC family permease [Mangrovihabitans endophyticus]|uniref:APC family permease n=1 Tax=Mangrovihabitans endophyticus TaxID=1751298 RepID=UPI00166C8516|nr:APC family permease [Mangrovihabitans endophyticus]